MAKGEWNVVDCAATHTPGAFVCDRETTPGTCARCGFNPEIEAARKAQIRAKAARGETPHATRTIRQEEDCAIGFHWKCRNCYAKTCPFRLEAKA